MDRGWAVEHALAPVHMRHEVYIYEPACLVEGADGDPPPTLARSWDQVNCPECVERRLRGDWSRKPAVVLAARRLGIPLPEIRWVPGTWRKK